MRGFTPWLSKCEGVMYPYAVCWQLRGLHPQPSLCPGGRVVFVAATGGVIMAAIDVCITAFVCCSSTIPGAHSAASCQRHPASMQHCHRPSLPHARRCRAVYAAPCLPPVTPPGLRSTVIPTRTLNSNCPFLSLTHTHTHTHTTHNFHACLLPVGAGSPTLHALLPLPVLLQGGGSAAAAEVQQGGGPSSSSAVGAPASHLHAIASAAVACTRALNNRLMLQGQKSRA